MTRLPLFAFTALALVGTANAASTVGINAAIRNKVVTRAANDPAAHPAILKARVGLGDQVQTANASMLQILLLDRSNFTVGSNARVTIDRFVYDPQRSASAVGASVVAVCVSVSHVGPRCCGVDRRRRGATNSWGSSIAPTMRNHLGRIGKQLTTGRRHRHGTEE